MLRKIRLTLAVLCFATVTLLFLDFTGTLHACAGRPKYSSCPRSWR